MNKSFWILLPLLTILSMVSHAEIYKWKDSNGNVRYSDVPPPSNVPHESMKGNKTGTAPAAPAQTQNSPPTGPDSAAIKIQEKAADDKNKELKDAELKIKQHNCEVAKANLQNLKLGGPVYKENDKGEREFLSDKDAADSLQQAQKDVEKYCNG